MKLKMSLIQLVLLKILIRIAIFDTRQSGKGFKDIKKNLLNAYAHEKYIEFHLPYYEIPQLSPC